MHPIVNKFIDELRGGDPQLAAMADEFKQAACAIEHEAVTNRDARTLFKAVCWIIRRNDHTLAERFEALGKLFALPRGPVVIGMKQLTGWI
jgi:hypothetical protein